MAYVSLLTTQTDADSPVDQTLMDTIRTDLDDHETRLSSISAFNGQSIYDDFACSVLDTDVWDSAVSGAGSLTMGLVGSDRHEIQVSAATGTAGIAASTKRMRFDITQLQDIYLEARIHTNGTNIGTFLFGFEDDTVPPATGTLLNYMGFIHGTNNHTLKLSTAKGGTVTNGTDNQGPIPTAYGSSSRMALRITSTAGPTFTLRGYLESSGVLVEVGGSPLSTNIPDTKYMRPKMAVFNGTPDLFIDYLLAYWITRPLTA